MSKFTASNGIELTNLGGTWGRTKILFVEDSHPSNPKKSRETNFDDEDFLALREFFLHERDTELGRWRWPEDRNYVVYFRSHGERFVHVYHEPSTGLHTEYRDEENDTSLGYSDAAQAYFAAHPVSKPWHDAKPGEAWVISYGGEEHAVISDGAYFLRQGGSEQEITDSRITGGRRIWPEDSNDS